MGNSNESSSITDYQGQIEQYIPEKPIIYEYGKVYNNLLHQKLNGNHIGWTYCSIYDLRNAKETWRLNIKIINDKLHFRFVFLERLGKEIVTAESVPLWIDSYTENMLTLKYTNILGDSYILELYNDNIHCYLMQSEKNMALKAIGIYGLLKLNKRIGIPVLI